MNLLKYAQEKLAPLINTVEFRAGDTVTVNYKIREGDKERVQQFTGVVLQVSGSGSEKTFTVRKISNGVGVERIFPLHSPFIESIEVNKKGKVKRSRIFYLRKRTGKRARIEEKLEKTEETPA